MSLIIELVVPDGAVQFLDDAIALVNAQRANFDPPQAALTREEYVFAVARDGVVLELKTEQRAINTAELQTDIDDVLADFNNG